MSVVFNGLKIVFWVIIEKLLTSEGSGPATETRLSKVAALNGRYS